MNTTLINLRAAWRRFRRRWADFREWWYELGWHRSWQFWAVAGAVMYSFWPAFRAPAIPVFFGFVLAGLGLLYVACRVILHRRTHHLTGEDLSARENSLIFAIAIIIAGALFAT